jgi:hypothetical protein
VVRLLPRRPCRGLAARSTTVLPSAERHESPTSARRHQKRTAPQTQPLPDLGPRPVSRGHDWTAPRSLEFNASPLLNPADHIQLLGRLRCCSGLGLHSGRGSGVRDGEGAPASPPALGPSIASALGDRGAGPASALPSRAYPYPTPPPCQPHTAGRHRNTKSNREQPGGAETKAATTGQTTGDEAGHGGTRGHVQRPLMTLNDVHGAGTASMSNRFILMASGY